MTSNPRIIKIENLNKARAILKDLGVDKIGINIMAPKTLHYLLKIEKVDSRAATILKQEMLSLGGEVAVPRRVYDFAQKKCDLIMMGTLKQFQKLQIKLKKQPFGLTEIGKEINDCLKNYLSPPPLLKWGRFKFDLAKRTYMMGILNITPDSFSDGGKFFDREKAIKHGLRMAKEGADMIDIGGESTRPGAKSLLLKEELNRVIPVIEALRDKVKVPISIDTYKSEVAKKAFSAGASIINDISGLRFDKNLAKLAAKKDIPVIIMHMQGTPRHMQKNPTYKCVTAEIIEFFRNRLQYALQQGINRDKIIIDPGIGFGKTREHNLEIIHNLSELKCLGLPIMIGPSRKSFIGLTLNLTIEERIEGTAATVAYAIAQGANIVRVHDVKEMSRVARMTEAMIRMK